MNEIAMMTVMVSVDYKASVCGYVIVWVFDGRLNMFLASFGTHMVYLLWKTSRGHFVFPIHL